MKEYILDIVGVCRVGPYHFNIPRRWLEGGQVGSSWCYSGDRCCERAGGTERCVRSHGQYTGVGWVVRYGGGRFYRDRVVARDGIVDREVLSVGSHSVRGQG